MLRWRTLEDVPEDFGPAVIALGNFDGVHSGHQHVLRTVVDHARRRQAQSVAITFDPHPVAVLRPERAPRMIMPLEHRLDAIEELGMDAVLVTEFTHELAQQTPEEYVRGTFVDTLHACEVVVGRDVRFGRGNSGDLTALRELGERYGFEVVTVDDIGVGEARRVSSTEVRAALDSGAVDAAADLLTRPHRIVGTVVHGKHRGRGLGFPTANLDRDAQGAIPADGVYAAWFVRLDLPTDHPDRRLPAAVSVGTNPTFGDITVRTVEAYVLDRTDLDLYGEHVAVDLVSHLRGMQRFASVEELLERMHQDVETTRERLGR